MITWTSIRSIVVGYFAGLDRRAYLSAAAVSLCYGFMLAVGAELDQFSKLEISTQLVVKSLALTLLSYLVVIVLYAALNKWNVRSEAQAMDSLAETYVRMNKVGFAWYRAFALITIPSVFFFLVVYPGIYGYDGAFHILQVQDPDTLFTSSYSMLYTLYLGAFIQFGASVGNVGLGLGLAMFFQMLFLCVVATKTVMFASWLSGSKIIKYLSLLFSAVFPFFLMIRVSTTQDAFFGGLFVLLVIELTKMSLMNDYFKSKKTVVYFIAVATLMMLLRNNGLYAYLIPAVFGLIVSTKRFGRYDRRLLRASLIVPILMYLCISGPLYSFCGVEKGKTFREMASIPSQRLCPDFSVNCPSRLSQFNLPSLIVQPPIRPARAVLECRPHKAGSYPGRACS